MRSDMDNFYRKNAALYEKLADAFDPNATGTHFSRHCPAAIDQVEPPNSPLIQDDNAMLVVARIRPMLADDLAERFPCAAYARLNEKTGQSKIIDLHDLYHYPYGPPKLKVRSISKMAVLRALLTFRSMYSPQSIASTSYTLPTRPQRQSSTIRLQSLCRLPDRAALAHYSLMARLARERPTRSVNSKSWPLAHYSII